MKNWRKWTAIIFRFWICGSAIFHSAFVAIFGSYAAILGHFLGVRVVTFCDIFAVTGDWASQSQKCFIGLTFLNCFSMHACMTNRSFAFYVYDIWDLGTSLLCSFRFQYCKTFHYIDINWDHTTSKIYKEVLYINQYSNPYIKLTFRCMLAVNLLR